MATQTTDGSSNTAIVAIVVLLLVLVLGFFYMNGAFTGQEEETQIELNVGGDEDGATGNEQSPPSDSENGGDGGSNPMKATPPFIIDLS